MTTLAESAKYYALMLLAVNRILTSRDPAPMIGPEHLLPGLSEEDAALRRAELPDVDLAIEAIRELERQGFVHGETTQIGFAEARLSLQARALLSQHYVASSMREAVMSWAAGLGLSGVSGMSEGQAADAIALCRLLRLA